MKTLKIHVFTLFKLNTQVRFPVVVSTEVTTRSLLLRSALTLAWAGGLRLLLCIWDVAGYNLNPETGCIDIGDFSQSFQGAPRALKGARIVSFDILVG